MNALQTTASANALAAYGAVDPYAALAAEMGGGGGAVYCKFNGDSGQYSYGSQSESIPVGTEIAINPASFRKGAICWKDKAVVGEHMADIGAGLAGIRTAAQMEASESHGPYAKQGDGWREQVAFDFKLAGEDTTIVYKATSQSSLRAFAALLRDFARGRAVNPGKTPIVRLGANSFEPKNNPGRKWAPEFKIVKWMTDDELGAATPGEDAGDYFDEPDATPAAPVQQIAATTRTAAPATAPAAPPTPANPPATAAAAPMPAGRRRAF